MKKSLLFMVAIFAIISFSSCEKDIEKSSMPLRSFTLRYSNSIPSYESLEDALDVTLRYNESGNSGSFVSFGQYADSIYFSIYDTANLDSFSVINARDLKNSYSDFLSLDEETSGYYTFEPSLSYCLYRYSINADRLMQVGDTVYKFFENGFAVCDTSAINNIVNLTESSFDLYNNNDTIGNISIRKITKGPNLGQGMLYIKEVSRERVKFIIQMENYAMSNFYRDYTLYLETLGYHRFLGIWWRCKRDLEHNMNIRYVFNGTNINRNVYDSKDNSSYLLTKIGPYQFTITPPYNDFANNYISSINGYTKTQYVKMNVIE